MYLRQGRHCTGRSEPVITNLNMIVWFFRRYSPPTFGRLARNSRDHSNITSRRLKKDECAGGAALPAQISSSFTLEESDKMSIERNEAPANRPCRTIVLNNRSPSPPILSRVGDRSPPGTLNKVPYEENRIISCRNWCSRYSQVSSNQ